MGRDQQNMSQHAAVGPVLHIYLRTYRIIKHKTKQM